MNANQTALGELGVSCPEIDNLVGAALASGALGAKLSGGGLGGCIIALVPAQLLDVVKQALLTAGAAKLWQVRIGDADRD